MLKQLYSLRDLKSQTHKDLFSASNHEEAKRLIHAAALPPSGPTLFAQYPDDFALFHHGEYNMTDGSIKGDLYTTGNKDECFFAANKIATVREIIQAYNEPEKKPTAKKKGAH